MRIVPVSEKKRRRNPTQTWVLRAEYFWLKETVLTVGRHTKSRTLARVPSWTNKNKLSLDAKIGVSSGRLLKVSYHTYSNVELNVEKSNKSTPFVRERKFAGSIQLYQRSNYLIEKIEKRREAQQFQDTSQPEVKTLDCNLKYSQTKDSRFLVFPLLLTKLRTWWIK